jgi:DNA polymerase epsilon subunit 1
MNDYCTCAGRFTHTVSREAVMEQLLTFQSIAKHYEMHLLDKTVSWVLKTNR